MPTVIGSPEAIREVCNRNIIIADLPVPSTGEILFMKYETNPYLRPEELYVYDPTHALLYDDGTMVMLWSFEPAVVRISNKDFDPYLRLGYSSTPYKTTRERWKIEYGEEKC